MTTPTLSRRPVDEPTRELRHLPTPKSDPTPVEVFGDTAGMFGLIATAVLAGYVAYTLAYGAPYWPRFVIGGVAAVSFTTALACWAVARRTRRYPS